MNYLLVAVPAAVANLLNPPTTTGGVGAGSPLNTYIIIKKVTVVNKTSGAVNISLFIGATGVGAAGTEWKWSATPVPASGSLEFFCQTRLDVGDFLTHLASVVTSLVIEIDAEIGIV